MPKFILTNCPFAWTLQEQLSDKIKTLPFCHAKEFARVSRVLGLLSTQFHPDTHFLYKNLARFGGYAFRKLLSHPLQEHLETLIEYMSEPELYITVDSIKADPNQYIGSDNEEEKNEILQSLTPEKVNHAFYALCAETLSEQVTFLHRLKESDQQRWILEQHEIQNKKARTHEEFTKHTAPLPGTEASTASTGLVRIFGGPDKFDQVIELMNQDRDFSDCVDIAGQIHGIYTDEEQIQWNFVIAKESDQDCITFYVANRENLALNFNDERLNFEFDRTQQNIVANNAISLIDIISERIPTSGNSYYLLPSTYKDLLCYNVKKNTTLALIAKYIRAFDLSSSYLDHPADIHDTLVNTPARTELIPYLLALRDKYHEEERLRLTQPELENFELSLPLFNLLMNIIDRHPEDAARSSFHP